MLCQLNQLQVIKPSLVSYLANESCAESESSNLKSSPLDAKNEVIHSWADDVESGSPNSSEESSSLDTTIEPDSNSELTFKTLINAEGRVCKEYTLPVRAYVEPTVYKTKIVVEKRMTPKSITIGIEFYVKANLGSAQMA